MIISIIFQAFVLLCEIITVGLIFLIYNLGIFCCQGKAMEPGINASNYIIAIRADIKIPLLSYFPSLTASLSYKDKIKRGDSLIFKQDNGYILRRVIGIPGDTVEIIDNQIKVNSNTMMSQNISGDNLFLETTVDGSLTYPILDDVKYSEESKTYTVGANSLFCLCDNRTVYIDSRVIGEYFINNIAYIPLFKLMNCNHMIIKFLFNYMNRIFLSVS